MGCSLAGSELSWVHHERMFEFCVARFIVKWVCCVRCCGAFVAIQSWKLRSSSRLGARAGTARCGGLVGSAGGGGVSDVRGGGGGGGCGGGDGDGSGGGGCGGGDGDTVNDGSVCQWWWRKR